MKHSAWMFHQIFTLEFPCLRRVSMWKCYQWTSKWLVSSTSSIYPAWYSVQAVMKTATLVAVLSKHNANMPSNAVSINTRTSSRGKKFSLNFQPLVGFHMVRAEFFSNFARLPVTASWTVSCGTVLLHRYCSSTYFSARCVFNPSSYLHEVLWKLQAFSIFYFILNAL